METANLYGTYIYHYYQWLLKIQRHRGRWLELDSPGCVHDVPGRWNGGPHTLRWYF